MTVGVPRFARSSPARRTCGYSGSRRPLSADRVVTVTAGAAAAIPEAPRLAPHRTQWQMCPSPRCPASPRTGYFRLLECLAAGEATWEEVMQHRTATATTSSTARHGPKTATEVLPAQRA